MVLKVDSPDILHKTEAGVVRLNLRDAAQVRTAYAEILASAAAYAPQARITGVSVQEMVGEGVEVIVGVDLDALADILVRVSHRAMHLDGQLAELDINPRMVRHRVRA